MCYFRTKIVSPGDLVQYHSRTLGAHVVGPSPNGPQFCHLRYIRPGGVTPVDDESAQLSRLEAMVVESPKSPESPDVTPMASQHICEENWIPKELVPPKKSVAAPKARAKAAPVPRAKPAAKRTSLGAQAGAKAAAKPA